MPCEEAVALVRLWRPQPEDKRIVHKECTDA
jgi:hypothetical protein